jgi:hypothetical protein
MHFPLFKDKQLSYGQRLSATSFLLSSAKIKKFLGAAPGLFL